MFFGKDLPKCSSVMVHSRHNPSVEVYRFLQKSHLPTVIVSLHRPAVNVQHLLHRSHIPTHNVLFMDTVSKRANAELLSNADYLFYPDLTELGKRLVHRLEQHPGEKVVVLDAISTLRQWYDQSTISLFLGSLQKCFCDCNTHLVMVNEEKFPALPNIYCNQVVEV